MNTQSTAAADTTHRAPRLGEDEIQQILRASWGLGSATQGTLGGEIDQNVKITAPDGASYVLKISPPDTDLALVRWHNEVLSHLAGRTPGVQTPRLVPSLAGEDIVPVTIGDRARAARLLTWIEGRTLRDLEHHPDTLLSDLGRAAARVSRALATMPTPSVDVQHDWDLRNARSVIADGLDTVADPDNAANVRTIMSWYDQIQESVESLPRQVVHQDLNDANVLVVATEGVAPRVSGVLDVNDAQFSMRVAEIAVCAGYGMIRKSDPLRAAAVVVAAFNELVPLTEDELRVVFPLAAARLCLNAVVWNKRVREQGSSYGADRMRHTWPTLARLARVVPELAEQVIRDACGRAVKTTDLALSTVADQRDQTRVAIVDLSPGSDLFDDVDWTDSEQVRTAVSDAVAAGTSIGAIAHLAPIQLRAHRRLPGLDEPATLQLGVGLLLALGDPVTTPLSATVIRVGSDGSITLRHRDGTGDLFTTWWGLEAPPIEGVELPTRSHIGTAPTAASADGLDGYVQVVAFRDDRLARRDLPRYVSKASADAWGALVLDPSPMLGIRQAVPRRFRDVTAVLSLRQQHIARSQRAYYQQPMNLVRGRGVWFYDENANAYLDSLNNVTHVGHSEPRVTEAALRQMRKLNTNSRFVYEGFADYAQRLAATLPDPLEVVFLVCSGSEANDLALRIARQVTGRQDVAILDGAYHGNTGVVTGISPNRYKGPGGAGAPPTTHEIPIPDRYRGRYGYDDLEAGTKFAADAKTLLDGMVARGCPPAAFIAESLMGTAGNIVLPNGFLAQSFAAARAVGALCVSDEVQVGVGRMGDTFWAFELGDVVPDIVTMGKPLGNGHPLAAVVTTREIAEAFDTGMKYFNTFGGNPVSCAIGTAVLDIIRDDNLQQHASDIGAYFYSQLIDLMGRHEIIGDVRGHGLYLGVELVRDRTTKEPAKSKAFLVTELMKERGVITFPNGVHDNVLKIKPPLPFQQADVDLYVEVLDEVLSLPQLH